ncbi:ABC transporter permease [Paenibacillus solani]|uniref:ABC transporter permease n=1 Tax=Paenibacillus solani TaxID=1705565 RepID=UPI003D2AE731
MKLIGLVRNENMKLYNMRSTWILLCVSFLSIIMVLLLTTLQSQPPSDYWTVTFNLFQTENQILYVILILFVSQIINYEFSYGTAKLLFIRPTSRLQIMFAKWVSAVQFSFLVLVFNLVSCMLLALPMSAAIVPLTTDDLHQLYFLFGIKLAAFICYATLFFALAVMIRSTAVFIIMSIVLMGSLQSLPSMIIFPQTGFLFSAGCWILFCGSILIVALTRFKKSDI